MDKRILIVIIPALLFTLVFLDSYSSPIFTTFGGSPEIEADKYHYSQFDFETGEYIELEYTVQVTSGPPIDIFLLDPPNFELYRRDRPFEYIEALSYLGAMDVERSGTLREHDTYYLVLDNTDAGMIPPTTGGVAFVEYELTYRIQESGGIFADFCSLFFLIITVVALVAYLFLRGSEKKKRPLPPPPPDPYLAQGDQVYAQGQQIQLSQQPRERPPPPPPDYTRPP